jgi:glycosyltransferase involved in cell wall biosynthesis
MLNGKKIVIVMPAYNAEKTLEKTYKEIPFEIVDDVILVDDASHDRTSETAAATGIRVIIHETNIGMGEHFNLPERGPVKPGQCL